MISSYNWLNPKIYLQTNWLKTILSIPKRDDKLLTASSPYLQFVSRSESAESRSWRTERRMIDAPRPLLIRHSACNSRSCARDPPYVRCVQQEKLRTFPSIPKRRHRIENPNPPATWQIVIEQFSRHVSSSSLDTQNWGMTIQPQYEIPRSHNSKKKRHNCFFFYILVGGLISKITWALEKRVTAGVY